MRAFQLALTIFSVVAMAACTGSNKPSSYTFPGCDTVQASGTSGGECLGGDMSSSEFECVQGKLLAQHNTCTADSDCVIVMCTNFSCVSSTSVAVNANAAGTYQDQLANEADKLCEVTGSNGNCGPTSECESFGGEPQIVSCQGGVCTQMAPDAGPCGFECNAQNGEVCCSSSVGCVFGNCCADTDCPSGEVCTQNECSLADGGF